MNPFETNLGVSDDKLGKLHAFADDHRAREQERQQAEAVELSEKKDYLANYQATLERIYDSMSFSEQRVIAREDGVYLVIRKSRDRLQLALTHKKDIDLSGYRPSFDEIQEWQEIDIDRVGGQTTAPRFHHWTKEQLDKVTFQSYWNRATEVNLSGLGEMGAEEVDRIYNATKNAIHVSDVLEAL